MSQNPVRDAIQDAIGDHEVILFMKGTPERPECGFSARTVAALRRSAREFAAVDILPDPRIRQELSALSNWPTIPQLFVKGELVGGCDIVTEMYESGELAEALGVAPADAPATRRRRARARRSAAADREPARLRSDHEVAAPRTPRSAPRRPRRPGTRARRATAAARSRCAPPNGPRSIASRVKPTVSAVSAASAAW